MAETLPGWGNFGALAYRIFQERQEFRSMATFKIGDEVRMRDGTAIWGQYPTLQMARGRVTGAAPDNAGAEKITVEFPDGTTLAGLDAGMFKPAAS